MSTAEKVKQKADKVRAEKNLKRIKPKVKITTTKKITTKKDNKAKEIKKVEEVKKPHNRVPIKGLLIMLISLYILTILVTTGVLH